MFQDQLNELLISLTRNYYNLSEKIANCSIEGISPPFSSYQSWKGDILSYCDSMYDNYYNLLREIGEEELERVNITMEEIVKSHRGVSPRFNLLQEVENIHSMIRKAFIQYFKGFPALSYEVLEKGFIAQELHLLLLLPQLYIGGGSLFYRLRPKDSDVISSNKDLFHIPFQKRTKCKNYRYSVAGYPSFYMSTSIETARIETDVTGEDAEYYACAITQRRGRELHLIDLTLPNRSLNFIERYSLLVFYPLIIACGLKVKEPEHAFRPEYVIPQLLSQVIRLHQDDTGFDGIVYASTKTKETSFTNSRQKNVILWVRGADKEEGYSTELADKVLLTSPVFFNGKVPNTDVEAQLKKLEFETVQVN